MGHAAGPPSNRFEGSCLRRSFRVYLNVEFLPFSLLLVALLSDGCAVSFRRFALSSKSKFAAQPLSMQRASSMTSLWSSGFLFLIPVHSLLRSFVTSYNLVSVAAVAIAVAVTVGLPSEFCRAGAPHCKRAVNGAAYSARPVH